MCPNETKEQLLQRLREKHAEGLLLWEQVKRGRT